MAAIGEGVKSALRVFDVLKLFDMVREPLSASEVVRRLGFPHSSTVALLKTMTAAGYLSHDQIDRRYMPTMQVTLLGHWLVDQIAPDRRLIDLIQTVSRETAETVAISGRSEMAMQFLHVERGRKPLALTVNAGDRSALLTTVIGIVALSWQSDEIIARYVERIHRQISDERAHAPLKKVMSRVREVRERGYGIGDSEYSRGIGALAWLLPPLPGGRRVVLSVAGASAAIREEQDLIVSSVTAALDNYIIG